MDPQKILGSSEANLNNFGEWRADPTHSSNLNLVEEMNQARKESCEELLRTTHQSGFVMPR